MKKLAVLLLAVSALLSGCVAYDAPYYDRDRGVHRGDRDGDHRERMDRDRDGDGVPNRQDRRPDDAHRY